MATAPKNERRTKNRCQLKIDGQTQPHNCDLTFSIVFVTIVFHCLAAKWFSFVRFRTHRHWNSYPKTKHMFAFGRFIWLYFRHGKYDLPRAFAFPNSNYANIHIPISISNSFTLFVLCVRLFLLFTFADVVWRRRIASNRFRWLHSQRRKLISLNRMATNCAPKHGSAYGIQSVRRHKINESW